MTFNEKYLGPAIAYQIFHKEDVPSFNTCFTDLGGYCKKAQEIQNTSELVARRIPIGNSKIYLGEYNAIRLFLREKIKEKPKSKVIRVFSSTHAGGTLMLGNYPLDGGLVLQNSKKLHTFYLLQYNDSFTHGCQENCYSKFAPGEERGEEEIAKRKQNAKMMNNLRRIAKAIQDEVNDYARTKRLKFKVVELSNCKFINHCIPHDHEDALLQQTGLIPQKMAHEALLERIYKRELKGFVGKRYIFEKKFLMKTYKFLVVKDLEISKDAQTPHLGVCIQKSGITT